MAPSVSRWSPLEEGATLVSGLEKAGVHRSCVKKVDFYVTCSTPRHEAVVRGATSLHCLCLERTAWQAWTEPYGEWVLKLGCLWPDWVQD